MRSTDASTAIADLGDGIHLIDAMYIRPGLAAMYLVVNRGRAAFVETGTSRSIPQALSALRVLGMSVEDVDFVIPTHVHLDHAGGAGTMMAAFPNARLVVHPRGRPHMIDPSRLWAATVDVYGEALARQLYGEIVPVPAERIIDAADGLQLDLNGRPLGFLDTPGHARHHCCVVDKKSKGIFTGDMFGLSYRELEVGGRPSALITTTPTQFDPEAMRASLDRLLSLAPDAMYLTHFSRVTDVGRLGAMLHRQLHEHVRIADRHVAKQGAERLSAITRDLETYFQAERARLHWTISDAEFDRIVMPDVRLNAMGLASWLENSMKQREGM
jgi:hydroxyacylglutathione hydrolase